METVPPSAPEVGTLPERIAIVLGMFPARSAAAETAGIGVDQLRLYEQGKAAPRFETLVNLAAAQGVSLEWLATGAGPMMRADRENPAQAEKTPSQSPNPMTREVVELSAQYWLTLSSRMEEPMAIADIARAIADMSAAVRGSTRDARFFLEHLRRQLDELHNRFEPVDTPSMSSHS